MRTKQRAKEEEQDGIHIKKGIQKRAYSLKSSEFFFLEKKGSPLGLMSKERATVQKQREQ